MAVYQFDEEMPLWSVPYIWPYSTVVCIASGASLHDSQIAHVQRARMQKRCKVIVCNNNIFKAPWADHWHFCDKQWWDWWKDKTELFKTFPNPITTYSREISYKEGFKRLEKFADGGLSTDPSRLSGNSSGQQIINIATLYGAKKVILIGYEMQPVVRDNYSHSHWFGHHPQKTDPSVFVSFKKNFETIPEAAAKLGVEIVNCSINTALECFPKASIFDVL